MNNLKLPQVFTILLLSILFMAVFVLKKHAQTVIKDTVIEKYEINPDSSETELLVKLRNRHDSIRASFVKTIDISKGSKDTIILGYLCGSTRKEVDQHTERLISSKKIEYTCCEENALFQSKYTIPTYRLYVDSKNFIDCKVCFFFDELENTKYGSLETIELRPLSGFITKETEKKLTKYLTQLYGEPNYFEGKDSPFWFYKNNEIMILTPNIRFENLAYKKWSEQKKAAQDSLQIEENINKAQTTQSDLK